MSILTYRIAENVGRRKHWQIDGQSPQFSTLQNLQFPYLFGRHYSPKFSSPIK